MRKLFLVATPEKILVTEPFMQKVGNKNEQLSDKPIKRVHEEILERQR